MLSLIYVYFVNENGNISKYINVTYQLWFIVSLNVTTTVLFKKVCENFSYIFSLLIFDRVRTLLCN